MSLTAEQQAALDTIRDSSAIANSATAATIAAEKYLRLSFAPPPNQKPTVSIFSPTPDTAFPAGADVSIEAEANDPDGQVVKVEFYDGDTFLGVDDNRPFACQVRNLSVGGHTFTARAIDNAGDFTISDPVNIVVNPSIPNQPPSVVMTSPKAGEIFKAPAQVTLNVSVSDMDGTVVKVQYFDNGIKLGESTAFPFGLLSTLALGAHALTAMATDDDGAFTTSQPIVVTVEAEGLLPTIVSEQMNDRQMMMSYDHHQSSRYARMQFLRVLSKPLESFQYRCWDFASGGTNVVFTGTEYWLEIEGRKISKINPVAGTTIINFKDVDMTQFTPGWLQARIVGNGAGETSATWFYPYKPVGVDFDSSAKYTPVVQGTYDFSNRVDRVHQWVKAPAVCSPTISPITRKRTYSKPTDLTRKNLHCEYLLPVRWGDIHRINRNKDKIDSTYDLQTYFWSTLHGKYPGCALLDGPRGVGEITMPTHFQLSTAVVNGVPRNFLYFADPWSIGKIDEEGTITRLVGYRHKAKLPHYEDSEWLKNPENLELLGDWRCSNKGFFELWDFDFDKRTLDINLNEPPVNGEPPHTVNVVMFAADTQNNRILRIEFSRNDRSVPPIVTEFITNIGDPWALRYDDAKLYVTERTSHRIAVYSADTGALIEVLVQGEFPVLGTYTCKANSDLIQMTPAPAVGDIIVFENPPSGIEAHKGYQVVSSTTQGTKLSFWPGSLPNIRPTMDGSGTARKPYVYVNGIRSTRATVAANLIKESPCCAPEGAYTWKDKVSGDKFLYWTSKQQADVRRINLRTRQWEICHSISMPSNSEFAKLTMDDGTFGEDGTTAVTNWSNQFFGGPEMHAPMPDPKPISVWWNMQTGGTGYWLTSAGYSSACCMGQGRFFSAHAAHGIYRITASQPGDMPYKDKATDPEIIGRNEWATKGLKLLYGPNAFGFHGLPIPWGQYGPNVDAYLKQFHERA